VSDKLSWTHICELISISNELERNFYLAQTLKDNWSVRELKRQKDTSLFLKLASSKNKEEILQLSATGINPYKKEDVIKDIYTLEFLGLPEVYIESKLEQSIIDNLQSFLLELGKGFAFVGRQYRLSIDNEHYYADLVFYHIYLKCYVVIDLKTRKIKHSDISQMNMYLGYFALDKNIETDNPPIGIILGADKNDTMIEFATYNMDSNLFVSKYELYLPNKEQLQKIVDDTLSEQK
jgi:predicted nuclease of restriction endonuclease-like (RecB) superfamily